MLTEHENHQFHEELNALLLRFQESLLKKICEEASEEPDEDGNVYDGSPLMLDSTVIVTCWRSMDGYTMTSLIVPHGQNPWLTAGLLRAPL